MRIAICDDQSRDRASVISLCNRLAQEENIALQSLEFPDGETLLAQMETGYDVVLLDIYMEAKNGVDTARELRRRGYSGAIVFITSSNEHFAQGYEVDAVHYLVKPIEFAAFKEAMARAIRFLKSAPQRPTISLMIDRQRMEVPLGSIRYIEVYNHTVFLHTTGPRLEINASLRGMAEQLSDRRFLRSHRSYIVNMDFVESISEDRNEIILSGGETLPLSRRERKEIQRKYFEYAWSKMRGSEDLPT